MVMTMSETKTAQLWFSGAHEVEVREQMLPLPEPGQLLVKTICSGISAGTEMLVYRGQLPAAMKLDASLPTFEQPPVYPLQYGYASVGEVIEIGEGLEADWLGKRVFAFQPHASHFCAAPAHVIAVPDDIAAEAAVFLANMETAVNLVQDGKPSIGEQVVILGQGIVGLLLTSLLAQCPLGQLYALDTFAQRRACAVRQGASQVFDSGSFMEISALKQQLAKIEQFPGADLIFEVSGVPEALNLAIELSGYTSRIVIGSWYGNKAAIVALGGEVHRNRVAISTSQVTTLAPHLSGRWDKRRRFAVCWDMIRKVNPQALITHRVYLEEADSLYKQLDQTPEAIIQAVFIYP
jgi:2-desacetyl-2-hydroxyethyl bacteriochlorophyllide A dehydrogenase